MSKDTTTKIILGTPVSDEIPNEFVSAVIFHMVDGSTNLNTIEEYEEIISGLPSELAFEILGIEETIFQLDMDGIVKYVDDATDNLIKTLQKNGTIL